MCKEWEQNGSNDLSREVPKKDIGIGKFFKHKASDKSKKK